MVQTEIVRYGGMPEWGVHFGEMEKDSFWQSARNLEVRCTDIWSREQEMYLAGQTADLFINERGCRTEDDWKCCIIYNAHYVTESKRPTPRQKYLGL